MGELGGGGGGVGLYRYAVYSCVAASHQLCMYICIAGHEVFRSNVQHLTRGHDNSHTYMCVKKQGNTTNMSNSFFTQKEKESCSGGTRTHDILLARQMF